MEKLEQRMYHLVMYNISPIQQGIQCYHAGIEYSLSFGENQDYKDWANIFKTVIILNGGTSNANKLTPGTMEKHSFELYKMGIDAAYFREPDLNDAMTALAFLVDERVFNKEKYPDPIGYLERPRNETERESNIILLKLAYDERTAILREWLKQFRLA